LSWSRRLRHHNYWGEAPDAQNQNDASIHELSFRSQLVFPDGFLDLSLDGT
jgi:hypothetical protein